MKTMIAGLSIIAVGAGITIVVNIRHEIEPAPIPPPAASVSHLMAHPTELAQARAFCEDNYAAAMDQRCGNVMAARQMQSANSFAAKAGAR